MINCVGMCSSFVLKMVVEIMISQHVGAQELVAPDFESDSYVCNTDMCV